MSIRSELTTKEMVDMVHRQLVAYVDMWPTKDSELRPLAEHIGRNILTGCEVRYRVPPVPPQRYTPEEMRSLHVNEDQRPLNDAGIGELIDRLGSAERQGGLEEVSKIAWELISRLA